MTHGTLTVADIQRCFWVDDTGTVRWKQSVEPVRKCDLWRFRGTVAGKLTKHSQGGVQYRSVRYTKQGKAYDIKAHVIASVLHNGKFPEGDIDHIDGNGLNNSGGNLRDVSRRVNICNAKLSRLNVSGVKGVTPYKRYPGMWQASASVGYKLNHLYWGDDFFLAVCARKSFEARNDRDSAYSSQGNLKITQTHVTNSVHTED